MRDARPAGGVRDEPDGRDEVGPRRDATGRTTARADAPAPSVRPVSPAHTAPAVRPVSPAHEAMPDRPVSPAHQAPTARPVSPARPTVAPPPGAGPTPSSSAPSPAAAPAARVAVPDEDAAPGDRPAGARPFAGAAAGRGARAELKRQLREQQRLRIITLVVASLLVLGALPLYFGIRTATRDPVFNTLDSLDVPPWAAGSIVDEVTGSRWCFKECRYRERTAESDRAPDETAQVYERALADSGWQRWQVSPCPDQPVDGHYTCWKRDEYTLDLWVRPPSCADDPLRLRPTVGPTEPGTADPAAPGGCAGSVVSFKVRNAIDDDRTKPTTTQDPGLTGEDPDPIFSDAPLPELTTTP
ncbi:MAG TPA: hypothetical protein VFR67_22310 [Pilimelia sp.]|nr:hypothetical protein [Pilimelia sp.]